MFGEPRRLVAVCPGQQQHKQPVRILERQLELLVVDLCEHRLVIANDQVILVCHFDFGVHEHIFVPEHDVFSRIWMTVRPLHALAQSKREFCARLIGFKRFRDVRNYAGPIRIVAHQWLVGLIAKQHREGTASDDGAAPGATVLADLGQRRDHHRILGADARSRAAACRRRPGTSALGPRPSPTLLSQPKFQLRLRPKLRMKHPGKVVA